MIIKDNRIVSDRTFAIRFKNFLKDIKVNDPASEEELEYFRSVAKELVLHQVDTVVDEGEKAYLKRCLTQDPTFLRRQADGRNRFDNKPNYNLL